MNSQLLQSRQTPVRGVTMRSPTQSGLKSSQNRADYSQTRNLPSTNPIREPTPDLMPRSERIASTAVPSGLNFTAKSRTNPSMSPQRGGIDGRDIQEVTNSFNNVLKKKNEEIEDLKRRLSENQQDETVKKAPRQSAIGENDVTRLIQQLEASSLELQKSRQNEINLAQIVQNYENQLHSQSEQNQRLAQELKELTQQNQHLISQLQGKNLDNRVSDLQKDHAKEIAALQAQLRDLQQASERNSNAQNEQLRKQNQELVGECEKLAMIVRQLQQELQARGDQNQLTVILQQRNAELDELKNKVSLLQEEKSRMEQKLVLMSTEVLRLENQVNIWKEHCNTIQQGQAPDQNKVINELQTKIATLEGHLNQLARDNEKLTQIIAIKDNEIEVLKSGNRRSNVENRTNEQLERELYEARNALAQKDVQLQQQQQDAAKTATLLTNELEKVTTHLRTRNQEKDDLQHRYELLLQQNANNSKYNDELAKSLQLGQEIEKLAGIVRQQADEIRNLKNKLADAEEQNKQQYLIIQTQTNVVNQAKQIAELEDALRRKNAEAIEWQQSFMNLQAAKDKEINGLMESLRNQIKTSQTDPALLNEYNKLKEKSGELAIANERLQVIIIERENELRLVKARVNELENQLGLLSNELINQRNLLEAKERDIAQLQRLLEDARQRQQPSANEDFLRNEINNLRQIIKDRENRIIELENQLASIENEENVKKQKRNADSRVHGQELEEVKAENERLKTQINSQQLFIDQLNRQLFDLQRNNNAAEQAQRIEQLLNQIQDLEKHLRYVSEERDNLSRQLLSAEALKNRVRELEVQGQIQSDQIRRLTQELDDARNELARRQGQLNDLNASQIRVKELESQSELLAAECNRLKELLRQKEFDNSNKYSQDLEKQQLQNRVNTLIGELEKQQAALREKQDEVMRLSLSIMEREKALSRVPQLEERNAQLEREIQILNEKIKYLTEDNIRKLIDENQALRQRLAETSDFERVKKDLETRITLLGNERNRFQETITMMTQEKLALQAQINELSNGDRVKYELQAEIERLKNQNQQKDADLKNAFNQIENLHQQLGESENTKAQLMRRLAELQEKIDSYERTTDGKGYQIQYLTQENQQLKQQIDNQNMAIQQLNQRLAQVSQLENERILLQNQINLLQADVARLNALVRSKDEELVSTRDIRYRFDNLAAKNQESLMKNVLVQAEVERIATENKEKSNIIIQLEQRLNNNNWEFEKKYLEQRVAQQAQEIEGMTPSVRKCQILEAEKAVWAGQQQQYEQVIANLNDQIRRLQEAADDGERVKRSQKDKDNQIQSSEFQIKMLREQLEQANNDIAQLKRQIGDLLAQLELTKQSESRIALLTQQLNAKTQEADGLRQELIRLSEAANRLQAEQGQLAASKQQLEITVRDLQGRLEFTNNEVNRLNKLCYELQQRLAASATLEERNARTTDALVLQTALTESLGARVNELLAREGEAAENVKRSKRAEQDKDNLLNEVKQLQANVQELYKVIGAKEQTIADLQNQLNASATLQYRVQSLESELNAQRQQNDDLRRRLIEAENRVKAAEAKVLEIQQLADDSVRKSGLSQNTIQSLEVRIQSLNGEIERLKQQVADEQRKRNEAEMKVYQIQAQSEEAIRVSKQQEQQIKQLEQQIQQLLQEVDRMRQICIDEQSKRAEAENRLFMLQQQGEENVKKSRLNQSQMSTLEQLVQKLQADLAKFQGIAGEEQQRRLEAESQKSILGIEIERLNTILKEKLSALEGLEKEKRLLIEAIQRAEERALNAERKAATVDERNATIEQLVIQLKDRDARLARLGDIEGNMQMLQFQLNDKSQQLAQALEQLKNYETIIGQLQQRVRELEYRVAELEGDAEKENVKRSNQKRNADDLQARLDAATQQLAEAQQKIRELQNAEAQLRMAAYEKEMWANEKNQLNAYIAKLTQDKESALAQVVLVTAQLEIADSTLKNWQIQVQVLQQQLQSKDKEYKELLAAYQKLDSSVNSQWADRNALEKEVQRLRSELSLAETQHNMIVQDIKNQLELHFAEQLRNELAQAKAEYERRLADALNAQQASYQDDIVKRSKAHGNELENYKAQMEMTLRNELEAQLSDLQMRMELDRRQLEEEKRVLALRVAQLEEQLEKQQEQLLHALNQEQDALKWKEIVERLEAQRQREIAEFRTFIEESRKLQIDSSASLQDAERTAYNTQIKQLSLRVSELMENLKVKDHENNELRASNAVHIREKSEIKMQLSVSNAAAQTQLEIDSLKRQIILEQLKSQTLSISQAFSSAGGEADIQRSKFEVLQKEIEELTIQRNMYKEQSERKSNELNQKNLELVEKIGQLDQLKLQYQENSSKIYILETKLLDKLQTEEVHIM